MLDNWIICMGFADYNFSDFWTPFLVKISKSLLCSTPLQGFTTLKGLYPLKRPGLNKESGPGLSWRRPTLPLMRSTIGAAGLNFSVRNGKRWNPDAIAT